MSISALSYVDNLTTWTANNEVDVVVDGAYDITTYHELELSYPGHYGKGFWIVTGEHRVTEVGPTASIHLWNETTQVTYGVCGGYMYDTEWHSFSIIAGWHSDFPSTMKLMVQLYTLTGADKDVVQLRNVRMAFIQLNDVDGLKVVGRDANTAGYHQTKAAWDYSAFAEVQLANNTSNTIWSMSANGLSNTSTYMSLFHVNGMNVYGDAAYANVNTMRTFVEFANGDGGLNGRAYMRTQPGYYPSMGYISDTTSTTSVNSRITVSSESISPANSEIDVYGGFFTMLLEKRAEDNFYEFTTNDTIVSGNTTPIVYQPGANTDPVTRYLVFAAGRARFDVASMNTSVNFSGVNLYNANNAYKGGGTVQNSQNFFTFGNVVADVDPRISVTYNPSSFSNDRYGPFSFLAIELDRNYVNSCTGLPGTAANHNSPTRTWANTAHVFSSNTTHYASMANVSTSAANNAYLRVTGFGFDEFIPADAEIGYIWMSPIVRKSGTGEVIWDNVRMAVANAAVGTSCAPATPWTTSWSWIAPDINFGVSTFWTLDNEPADGGTASRNGVWNTLPTAAQVRASNFGFLLRPRATSGSPTAQVAYVFAVVYYRIPGETFNRVVTSAVGVNAVVSREHDIGKVTARTISGAVSSVKSFFTEQSAGSITVEDATLVKDVSSARALTSSILATKLATAIGQIKSITANTVVSSIKAITPTPKATANVSYAVTASQRAIGKAPFFDVTNLYLDRQFDIGQVVRSASVSTSASVLKNTGLAQALSITTTVSRLHAIGKAVQRTVTSTARKTHAIGRSFATSAAVTAWLVKSKSTRYYIGAALTMSTTVTSRKAVAASRSAGSILSSALLALSRGYNIGATVGVTATASSLPKAIGKAKKVVSATVARTTKAVSTATDLQVSATASSRKAIGRVRSVAVSATASLRKIIGRVRTRTVTMAITSRKAVGRFDTATVSSAASLRKAVGVTDAVSLVLSASVRKAVGKAVKRTVSTTARVSKAITATKLATVAATASLRKAVTASYTATVTATASVLKRIGQATRTATVSTLATLATSVGGLVKVLRYNFRQLARLVSTGDFTFKLSDSEPTSHQQIINNVAIIPLPTAETFTHVQEAAETIAVQAPTAQVFTIKL